MSGLGLSSREECVDARSDVQYQHSEAADGGDRTYQGVGVALQVSDPDLAHSSGAREHGGSHREKLWCAKIPSEITQPSA